MPPSNFVFVESLESLSLAPDDEHHLARALRLRPGEIVTASDGAGSYRQCRWGSGLTADGPICVAPLPSPPITVGFAPVKGERPEWTVQKLTELGVDHIVVLKTARSVVRWDNVDRLAKVARQASMQSQRCYLPSVEGPVPVTAAGGALAHFDGAPLSLLQPVVLIGPEGGWAPDELSLDLPHVSLGPRVLRSETAAVAAAVLLTAARG